jgi:hypothetical protein
MLRTMSDEEVQLQKDRVRELYMSAWTVDNFTAILMDVSAGGTGYNEDIARVKAHKIVSWLSTIVRVDVPERRKIETFKVGE